MTFDPLAALAGGGLIGLAAALVHLGHGRVAGVSGIFGGLIGRPPTDFAFRVAFVLGLVAAGIGVALLVPGMVPAFVTPSAIAIVSGLLVGFGTRLGNGCTSGHGICGVGRLAPRSLFATGVFMASGALTVLVVRALARGA